MKELEAVVLKSESDLFQTMAELGGSAIPRAEAKRMMERSKCDENAKAMAMMGFNAGRTRLNVMLETLGRPPID